MCDGIFRFFRFLSIRARTARQDQTRQDIASLTKIVPIILSGGSGSRLWPLSRESCPKQFLPLFGDRTMVQETALRTVGDSFAAPIVICSEHHRFLMAEQLRTIDVKPQSIVLEPVARNTAPAAAVAALLVQACAPDDVMMILASDHVIEHADRFRDAVLPGRDAAVGGALVTFGIQPDKPETGYGYIQRGAPVADVPGCFTVERFVEKPDAVTARSYVDDGRYFWNSGMFLFSPSDYLAELENQCPAMITACRRALEAARSDSDFLCLDADAFSDSPSDSIDYAVMEHTRNAVIVPVDLGWSDVGAWSALWETGDQDDNHNVTIGDVIIRDVHGSYIRSEGATIAVNGIDDIVVIATDDALLVADKSRVQDVKSVVDRIRADGRDGNQAHTTMHRPWGWYQTIKVGTRYQVKQICLKPRAAISLQMHYHRAEHWVVVEGQARVTRDGDVTDLATNESTYIPIGMTHRLENPTDGVLKIIEIQSGSYLGEDDIVRFEDVYGRSS